MCIIYIHNLHFKQTLKAQKVNKSHQMKNKNIFSLEFKAEETWDPVFICVHHKYTYLYASLFTYSLCASVWPDNQNYCKVVKFYYKTWGGGVGDKSFFLLNVPF